MGEQFFLHYLLCYDIVITGSGVELCKLFRHVLSEDSLFPVTLTRKESYQQLTQVTVCCCLSPYRQSLQKSGDAIITLFVAGWSISCQGPLWPWGNWRMIREDLLWRVGEDVDLLLRAVVLFGGALDLHFLWLNADCEESLYEHIPQSLLTHVVFSNVSHVESKNGFSPQLISTTYLKYLLRVVPYLILSTICSDEVP